MRLCDMCGKPLKGGYGIDGALVCRNCEPTLHTEIERLRKAGLRVNAMHIAKRIYHETHSNGDYLLRDLPTDLWAKAKHRAVDDNDSLRDLILKAMYTYLK